MSTSYSDYFETYSNQSSAECMGLISIVSLFMFIQKYTPSHTTAASSIHNPISPITESIILMSPYDLDIKMRLTRSVLTSISSKNAATTNGNRPTDIQDAVRPNNGGKIVVPVYATAI